MNTLKVTLGKFALPLVGITFIVLGVLSAKSGSVGEIILGVLEIVTGVCCLCAS